MDEVKTSVSFRSSSRQWGIGRGLQVGYLSFGIGFKVCASLRVPSGAKREVSSTPKTVVLIVRRLAIGVQWRERAVLSRSIDLCLNRASFYFILNPVKE